jgi:UDPglucose--hexose-1-phosphate uridylyltransferase
MEGERCELVLYTSDHDATFWSLGVPGIRAVIDMWAERTGALGGRDDVEYVLIFENRGAEVGATIAHPHGQIYAYDHVPSRQSHRLKAPWAPDPEPGDRLITERGSWMAWVPYAPTYPHSVEVAPRQRIADLPSMADEDRDVFAAILAEVLERLDRLYGQPIPYMMWLNQRPTVEVGYENAWFNVEIVSPWRSAGVQRFIAAAEVASEEYFNPIVPEDFAACLRELG